MKGSKTDSVFIRKAISGDSILISNLIKQTTLEFQQQDLTDEGKESLFETLDPIVISNNIGSGTFQYPVAVHAKSIAGVIALKDNRHLYHLFVDKEYQGRGIARKLWAAASNQSMSMGNKGYFTVNSSTYALDFYQKLDFVPTSKATWKNGIRSTPMEWKNNKP